LAEINHLIDNDIKGGGEYQLTHALDNMRTAGLRMLPGTVDAWMDCGNKDVTVETNGRVLEFIGMEGELVSPSATITNSTIIQPCFIGEGAVIRDSIVGPRVSIGAGSSIVNCELSDCLIQGDSVVSGMNLVNSMIGAHASLDGKFSSLSLGDYCRLDA
jgi:glucose-1-phosphate thymidylyltransferase